MCLLAEVYVEGNDHTIYSGNVLVLIGYLGSKWIVFWIVEDNVWPVVTSKGT